MKIQTLEKIETPRLLIRPVQLGDELEINQAINHSLETLKRWMPWAKDPSLETTRDFVQQSAKNWQLKGSNDFPMVVIHKKDQRIIAASGFNEKSDPLKSLYEIGFWIDTDYQGQGIVTEYVTALTRYALEELQAKRVQISTQVENKKSVAVAKRLGFHCEATIKDNCIDCETNQPADSYIFVCNDINELPSLQYEVTSI